jgi:hypothetical protein
MLGVLLTSWTIRLALVGFAAVLAWRVSSKPESPVSARRWRWAWTLSCLFFVLHVISAFHFHHHWSHQHALADTAEQTRQLMGWTFGEGLYFSYLFLLVWLADVSWWWWDETSYQRRPRWLDGAIQLYLLFIAFNGAVVFKSGVIRYAGIAATLGLALVAGKRLWQPRAAAARLTNTAPLPESSTS